MSALCQVVGLPGRGSRLVQLARLLAGVVTPAPRRQHPSALLGARNLAALSDNGRAPASAYSAHALHARTSSTAGSNAGWKQQGPSSSFPSRRFLHIPPDAATAPPSSPPTRVPEGVLPVAPPPIERLTADEIMQYVRSLDIMPLHVLRLRVMLPSELLEDTVPKYVRVCVETATMHPGTTSNPVTMPNPKTRCQRTVCTSMHRDHAHPSPDIDAFAGV